MISLIAIVGSNVSTAINTDLNNWVTTISTVVLAVATIVLAAITIYHARVTRKILAAQSDPFIIVTVVHDEERSSMLMLVVKNIGAGYAHDIHFEFSQPFVPVKAWGLEKLDGSTQQMKDGPLIDGIQALGPGESRCVDWGQFGGLLDSLGENKLVVTCSFKKNGRDMLPTKCPLDFESFRGTVAHESTAVLSLQAQSEIALQLKNLNSTISNK